MGDPHGTNHNSSYAKGWRYCESRIRCLNTRQILERRHGQAKGNLRILAQEGQSLLANNRELIRVVVSVSPSSSVKVKEGATSTISKWYEAVRVYILFWLRLDIHRWKRS